MIAASVAARAANAELEKIPDLGQRLAALGITSRGNGTFAKQTIVRTINLFTGLITMQQTFDGAPFAMQKDISRIRTLERKITKAGNRIRGRSRGPSKTKQLMNAMTDKALQNVLGGCPPKC